MLAVRTEALGWLGTLTRETDISGRLGLKMLGYWYWGCGGNPGGEDGVADGLAEDGAGDVADGLAEADGVAFGEDLEDFSVDGDLEDTGDDDLEEVGVDGEELLGLEEQSDALLCNFDVSFTPATLSQSTVLFRSRITLALIWNDPEASPSWIVWTEIETLPRILNLFPQKENFWYCRSNIFNPNSLTKL